MSYLSLFPEVIRSGLGHSLVGKAQESGKIELSYVQIRDFSKDKHRSVDDVVYGGGAGMLLKPDVMFEAWKSIASDQAPHTILLSPQGRCLTQERAKALTTEHEHLIFVCGHYEGVDERFIDLCVDEEMSIGDYVLTGGEFAAMVASDVIIRLLPGVVGNEESVTGDSLENGLLKAPQFTRPREFQGLVVPEVLLNGNHALIEQWRMRESIERTRKKRPDLYEKWELEQRKREPKKDRD